MIPTIERDELKGKMDRGEPFTLVETLPEFMYRQGHLPGAVNLPPNRVREMAPRVLPDKGAEIVVYCASATWHASENAARELAALGYNNVRDYAEGKEGWTAAGLPVEKEEQAPATTPS